MSTLVATQCTAIERGTRVAVSLDAPAELRSRIAQVDLALYTELGLDAWQVRTEERLKPDGARAWPLSWTFTRTNARDQRYSIEAQAFDAKGETLAELRAVGIFRDQETIERTLRFDASCSSPCGDMQTCSDGRCIDAEALADMGTQAPDAGAAGGSATGAQTSAACVDSKDCADTCGADRGACDSLVSCHLEQGEPRCGECPDGFAEAGANGCKVLLSGIATEGASLEPDFTPEQTEYTLHTGLLKHDWQLTPSAAASDATFEVEGEPLAQGEAIAAERFAPGVESFSIEPQARGHEGLRYRIALRASGMQRDFVKPAAPRRDAQFGFRMAVEGDTLVTAAVGDNSQARGVNPPDGDADGGGADDSGAVYVHRRSGSRWEQEAYIKASDASAGDEFGTGVALEGDTLVVGASKADGSGAVYVYERSGDVWREQAKLTPDEPQNNADFGQSVTLQGNALVVGAGSYDTGGANDTGAAFLYTRAAPGEPWEFARRVLPQMPIGYAWFGSSVKLGGDYLVVGATGEGNGTVASGAAYVFRSDTFEAVDVLRPSAAAPAGFFGEYSAIAGDTIVVSSFNNSAGLASGVVYVYTRTTDGKFEQKYALQASNASGGDQFGSSVSLTADHLLVGAAHESSGARGINGALSGPAADRSGAAYLFARVNQGFTQIAHIKADQPQNGAQFGCTVALNGADIVIAADGDAHAASGSGAVYIFR